jgi:S-formylglutathione hydrolase FrmB
MRGTGRGVFGALGIMLATSTLALTPPSPAGAVPPTLPAPNANGITLQSLSEVGGDPRMLDATVRTSAIFTPQPGATPSINPVVQPVKVRILLPAGYRAEPAQRYPVLYLLHGGADDGESWSKTGKGNVKSIVDASSFPGIVVMPEGGKAGWYSDWAGHTDGHFRPLWETFHVRQLVGWIDANFPTVAHRSGRTVAGVSMGGYGALRYAGRFPDVFSGVGVFSGGTNIREPGAQSIVNDSMWFYGAAFFWTGLLDGNFRVTGSTQQRMETVLGPAAGWGAVNPYDLASAYNAYDGEMVLYSGNSGSDANIGAWNTAFHDRLTAVGVDHRFCIGTGDHSWGYWREDLRDFLAQRYGGASASAACPNGWGAPRP